MPATDVEELSGNTIPAAQRPATTAVGGLDIENGVAETGPHPPLDRIPGAMRPIASNHKIIPVWKELALRIFKYLHSIELDFNSLSVVCFEEAGKEASPPHISVGVPPGSLSVEVAKAMAVRCKEIVDEYQLDDVQVSFRECVIFR